jgi:hypothetical protein
LAPDLALVTTLSQAGCRVMAEGRYNSPELAAQAKRHGMGGDRRLSHYPAGAYLPVVLQRTPGGGE